MWRTHLVIHRYEAAPKFHRATIFYKQQWLQYLVTAASEVLYGAVSSVSSTVEASSEQMRSFEKLFLPLSYAVSSFRDFFWTNKLL
jgi:hypothetical protein